MFCKYIQKNLSAYLDGELSRVSKHLIKKHILSCENCRRKLEFFIWVIRLTEKKENYQLSNDFVSNLEQKIIKSKVDTKKQSIFKLSLKKVICCFGVVFIMVGIYFLLFKPLHKLEYPMATLSYQTKSIYYSKNEIIWANVVNQTRRW